MKISEILNDAGRPIAYHPRLRAIAGSVNAAILLCQLLYWTGRQADPNGWILKRISIADEDSAGEQQAYNQSLQYETGLTKAELRAARSLLRQRGLVRERYHRLTHIMGFQIDHRKLQRMWESTQGQVLDQQVGKHESALRSAEIRNSLNGNYIDYAETTTEKTAPAPRVNESEPVSLPATPLEALEHPMIQLFQQVCGRIPGKRDYGVVIDVIRHFEQRHAAATADFLRPYWLAWSSRRRASDNRPYDPSSLTWLTEWAMNDHIPPTSEGGRDETRRPARHHPGRRHAPLQGRPADQVLCEADLAAARRIEDRRQRAGLPHVQ